MCTTIAFLYGDILVLEAYMRIVVVLNVHPSLKMPYMELVCALDKKCKMTFMRLTTEWQEYWQTGSDVFGHRNRKWLAGKDFNSFHF